MAAGGASDGGEQEGISSHQLHRILGVTYKAVWFITQRLREATSDGFFSDPKAQIAADTADVERAGIALRQIAGKWVDLSAD